MWVLACYLDAWNVVEAERPRLNIRHRHVENSVKELEGRSWQDG